MHRYDVSFCHIAIFGQFFKKIFYKTSDQKSFILGMKSPQQKWYLDCSDKVAVFKQKIFLNHIYNIVMKFGSYMHLNKFSRNLLKSSLFDHFNWIMLMIFLVVT